MRRFVLLSTFAVSLGFSLLGPSTPAAAEPPGPIEASPAAAAIVAPLSMPSEAASAPSAPAPSAMTAGIAPAAPEKPAPEKLAPEAAPEIAAKPKPPAPPAVVAKINLSSQRMEVSVNGATLHTWAISSGRAGYASPRGTWRVQWTSRIWYSKKYDNAPMPHAVFFTGGVAVHATSATGMLGRPASHGCIRLAPGNAAQFYALVQKHGNKQTQIQVFGSPPNGAVASRRDRDGDEDTGRSTRPDRRRVTSRRTASLDDGRPSSFVQNGIRYVRVW